MQINQLLTNKQLTDKSMAIMARGWRVPICDKQFEGKCDRYHMKAKAGMGTGRYLAVL